MSFLMVIPKKANAAEIIPVNISVKYGQTEARKIFNMINEMRTSSTDAWYWNEDDTTKTTCNALSELAYDYDLERLAMKRAAEIALSYSHTRPNGGRSFSIYSEEGITNWRSLGENIAAGYLSAEAVNMGWREDNENYIGQGHRRNMLSADFNCVGIGHVYYNGYHYWVEEFAYRTSVNITETAANDSEQPAALSVDSSKITGFKATFDKTSYTLRAGESTAASITKSGITVSGQWPVEVDRIVTDTPTISVANASIASYNNGKISGLAEGTTTLTASLYGLTAANMPTVSVHESGDKDNTDKDQKETETKDSDKDQKETEVKDQDKNQQQTETPNTKPNQDQNQKPQTVKKTTKKIKLNRKKLTLKKGKTFKLKVTLTPKDSKDKIVYRTSNRKIATVSKTGKIKAKKKGKVKITVISGKKKAVCTVKVK
ncbi:MAG: CAP domain-containing protein [Hominisplanchenecus sp.]|uniref:CAP domain-containing protein n=2 Tax=Hominisplanchenecus sp. TaxID=3038130 RepID=UPI00399B8F7D